MSHFRRTAPISFSKVGCAAVTRRTDHDLPHLIGAAAVDRTMYQGYMLVGAYHVCISYVSVGNTYTSYTDNHVGPITGDHS